jgi:oligopeptidase B
MPDQSAGAEPESSGEDPLQRGSLDTTPVPPAPERRPTVLRAHGDERVDDWYWLRNRDDPAVLAHLEAENSYTEAVLAHLAPLRQSLFEEMVARIAETDLSVPVRLGPWWYYTRTEEQKSYAIHCRRPAAPGEDPPLDPRPAPDEQVLLDENELARGLEFFEVGNLVVSPDHRWLAYATDITGGEMFDLEFRRLDGAGVGAGGGAGRGRAPAAPGTPGEAPEIIGDTYYGLAWAKDSATVFYTRVDEAMRPYRLWRHRLGTDPSEDVLVLEEPDERFTLSIGWTKDRVYVTAAVQSNTTSETWVVPGDDPQAAPRLVEPRRPGIEYGIEHHAGPDGGPGWFVILTNDAAQDFRLVVAPAGSPGRDRWQEVLPHRPGTRVEDVDVFDHWLVVSERSCGEPRIRVVPLAGGEGRGGESGNVFGGDPLGRSRLIPSAEHPSTTFEGPNPEHSSTMLRYEQTSLVSPRAVLDANLETGDVTLRRRQPVLGGYDPGRYRTYRLWADGEGGVRVPMSVVHRVDLLDDPEAPPGTPPAVPAPCLLYGYGAYEHSVDPVFSSLRLSLLDRGFVYAVAHVRGGGELGRPWYEDGKTAAKPHTFSDFVACARHLIAAGFTAPDRLAARGGSAGGLLVGAVVNQAPELFRAAVAEVPFVDCLTTMMDDTLPLTVGEWEEWGNPVSDPVAYAVMKSYSPYDNVRSHDHDGAPVHHPDVLATAGLHDARVGFWEPAKWVAKLRAAEPGNRVLLRTELVAGHGGPSGRYDAWRDEALVYAFLIDTMARSPGGGSEREPGEPRPPTWPPASGSS